MADSGKAFLKGGCGCLLLFLFVAGCTALLGGWARADVFGLVLIFLIGGVIGLVVNAIYQRGRRDAAEDPPPPPPPPRF